MFGTWNNFVICRTRNLERLYHRIYETISCDVIRETSTRERADARQGWLARNSAAPCGDSAKDDTPVCGFVNTENNSGLVVFVNTENSCYVFDFARAESHLPKFTRSNLLNWKSSVAPVQPNQGQVQPVQHQVRPVQHQVQPVQRQVQQVQNQVKPVHQALLVQHQIESSSCV